jgi:hypothetical protein
MVTRFISSHLYECLQFSLFCDLVVGLRDDNKNDL